MTTRDLIHNIKAVKGFTAASISVTQTGDTIDLAGYESCTFLLSTGTGSLSTSNYWTAKLQHGDASDLSDAVDVPAANVMGAMGSDADNKLDSSNDSSTTHKLGYIGGKRYVRIVLTLTGTMTQVMGCEALLGNPRHAPVL